MNSVLETFQNKASLILVLICSICVHDYVLKYL